MVSEETDIFDKVFLVVEDEYLVAADILDVLGRAGADVIGPVSSLEGALKLVDEAEQIDAAVLDIHLRGAEVYPVADALSLRNVPFAFLTAYDRGDLPERFREAPFLQKPVDPDELLQLLSRL
ncbi:CheY chemotaxis protein or a CheY-like REC (receiver) domain [Rhizobium sp. 9140]|nr:CheY chemotaxis protein or a CheY-like REC (receiver) domain [Rhizobium sp. 9140]